LWIPLNERIEGERQSEDRVTLQITLVIGDTFGCLVNRFQGGFLIYLGNYLNQNQAKIIESLSKNAKA
jgi:hypothetical protein